MKLYHYTKFRTAATRILPYKELRFNSIEHANDPTENLLHLTNYVDAIYPNTDSFDFLKAIHFQNEWQFLSFSIDNKNNGVFTKGNELHRMWALYGENNSGICLEIDYNKFISENQKLIEMYSSNDDVVDYNDHALRAMPRSPIGKKSNPDIPPSAVNTNDVSQNALSETEINSRFFTKNTDWRGEAEYRFIAYNNNNDGLLFSIKNSLERVYLGVGFSRYFVPSILESISSDIVRCMTLDISGNYEIKDLPHNNKK